ncbi:hypothetical protein [Planctomicrobium sp. SH664]|uniref:hypothetical protein n=1 Tax=Planctomicrobium sp. SH664 TaxID=3448125 RepID=UPI003F5AF134
MSTFEDLVSSRRAWIENELKPWCLTAKRRDLVLAEAEWPNIGGKAATEKTLWFWAWSRFPGLCDAALSGISETHPVTIHLEGGGTAHGFPDARESKYGQLVLVGADGQAHGPYSIDEIREIVCGGEGNSASAQTQ